MVFSETQVLGFRLSIGKSGIRCGTLDSTVKKILVNAPDSDFEDATEKNQLDDLIAIGSDDGSITLLGSRKGALFEIAINRGKPPIDNSPPGILFLQFLDKDDNKYIVSGNFAGQSKIL